MLIDDFRKKNLQLFNAIVGQKEKTKRK